jgi:hypothetical protein
VVHDRKVHAAKLAAFVPLTREIFGPLYGQGGSPAVTGPVVGLIFHIARALDPLFDFAHAGEVFVELRLIGPADLAAQAAGMLLNAVEDAECALASLVVKQAVEGQ